MKIYDYLKEATLQELSAETFSEIKNSLENINTDSISETSKALDTLEAADSFGDRTVIYRNSYDKLKSAGCEDNDTISLSEFDQLIKLCEAFQKKIKTPCKKAAKELKAAGIESATRFVHY